MRKLFLLPLLLVPGTAWGAPPPAAEAEMMAASAALAGHDDGFWLNDEPGAPALLDRWWRSTEAWAGAELAAGRKLDAAAKAFGAGQRVVAVRASRSEGCGKGARS